MLSQWYMLVVSVVRVTNMWVTAGWVFMNLLWQTRILGVVFLGKLTGSQLVKKFPAL